MINILPPQPGVGMAFFSLEWVANSKELKEDKLMHLMVDMHCTVYTVQPLPNVTILLLVQVKFTYHQYTITLALDRI